MIQKIYNFEQMHDIVGTLWFLLPGGFANMAPIVFNRLPLLTMPVDFNRKFRGQPIFGPHKTYRGFVVGVLVAVLVVYIQRLLADHMTSYNLVDYKTYSPWLLGFLLGFGALCGDLVKSFFKRRVSIPAGKSWVPFDQVDWVIGAMVFTAPIVSLGYIRQLTALLIFGLLHPLSNLLGYWLRFKPNKF